MRSAAVVGEDLDILQQSLRIDRALVHLDDHALFVQQERGRNCEIPATVEQVTVNDVVNAGHIFRRKKHRKGEPLLRRERPCLVRIGRVVNVYRKNLQLLWPAPAGSDSEASTDRRRAAPSSPRS